MYARITAYFINILGTVFFNIISILCFFLRIYHSKDGVLKIEPFNYRCPSRIFDWLHMSDDFILQNFSNELQNGMTLQNFWNFFNFVRKLILVFSFLYFENLLTTKVGRNARLVCQKWPNFKEDSQMSLIYNKSSIMLHLNGYYNAMVS